MKILVMYVLFAMLGVVVLVYVVHTLTLPMKFISLLLLLPLQIPSSFPSFLYVVVCFKFVFILLLLYFIIINIIIIGGTVCYYYAAALLHYNYYSLIIIILFLLLFFFY